MKKKIGIFAAMFVSLGTLMAGSAFAATTYTPVAGTSANFNKYLIMDAGDTVPNATFSFTVAPGTAISADISSNATMEVMAGIGTPTIADVTFSPTDTTATSAGNNIDVARTNVQRGGTAGDTVQLDAGEKFATKQATINFSSVSFPEPGIYRYIITETANTDHAAAGIIHDTDVDRVLDVYVVDTNETVTEAWIYDGVEYTTEAAAQAVAGAEHYSEITHRPASAPGTLSVAGYVLHTDVSNVAISSSMGSNDVQSAGAALSDKTDGFTNEYASKDLKVEKEVTGNQASRDKYFEFTVTCTDVADADSYVVSIADDSNANTNDGSADATSGAAKTGGTIEANAGKTNPTTVTGAQLKAGQKFYLQHGQSVVIRGLAPNASYTVTENAEDYASAVKSGDTNSGVLGTVAGSNKMATAGFTNTRNGIIPTGIVSATSVGIGIAFIALIGIVLIVFKSKKRNQEV